MIPPNSARAATAIPISCSALRPPEPPVVLGTTTGIGVVVVPAGVVVAGVEVVWPGTPTSGADANAAGATANAAASRVTASAARIRCVLCVTASNIAAGRSLDCWVMAPKQRQIRIEQRLTPDVMEQMQARTDEQLENERKYRSIAYSILGARAAERYDAPAARTWFEKAMVASTHPQERIQIRRMADASLALAEHRAGDLKIAVEKLGQEAPSSRQLFGLRVMGLIAPGRSARPLLRIRGALVLIGAIIVLIAAATGIVKAVSLAAGGLSWPASVLLGVILDIVVIVILAMFGRRRQKAARAKAAAGGA